MKYSTFLLVFLSMAFTLLLTVALMEHSVLGLLLGTPERVSEDDIRLTFSALKRIVGVLPYTLGVFIAGSFVLAIIQGFKTRWHPFSLAVLAILFVPMFYNIFLADTAAVVANLEATEASDELSRVQKSLSDAVLQHHIGLIGFFAAALVQSAYILFTLEADDKED